MLAFTVPAGVDFRNADLKAKTETESTKRAGRASAFRTCEWWKPMAKPMQRPVLTGDHTLLSFLDLPCYIHP